MKTATPHGKLASLWTRLCDRSAELWRSAVTPHSSEERTLADDSLLVFFKRPFIGMIIEFIGFIGLFG